jgi:hypothetical protein
MGWVEMLEQWDRKTLTRSYVTGGFFGNVLVDWVRTGGGNSTETNETERWRSKTNQELKDSSDLLRIEIAEGTLQIAASWNDEYRERSGPGFRHSLCGDSCGCGNKREDF